MEVQLSCDIIDMYSRIRGDYRGELLHDLAVDNVAHITRQCGTSNEVLVKNDAGPETERTNVKVGC